MRIRTTFFVGYFLLLIAGFFLFAQWIRNDVLKNYLETVEEGMVDTVRILAALLETKDDDGLDGLDELKMVFGVAHEMKFAATIYEVTKTRISTDVYVTDDKGIILFDSGNPSNVGKDFSRWNDVLHTLRGEYGVRATRRDPGDPRSIILHVAAPVRRDGKIAGVVTAYKPVNFIHLFIERAKEKIIRNAVLASILVSGLALLFSAWLTAPVTALTRYARKIRTEGKAEMPNLGRGEIAELGHAFEQMCEALEGKHYVENYVQHLTHEMKSPISAIQGALELIDDPGLATERRSKLLRNAQYEIERLGQIVQRMLQLAALENRKTLESVAPVDMGTQVRELLDNVREQFPSVEFRTKIDVGKSLVVPGDPLLLRQAVDNLVRNAIDFGSAQGTIEIDVEQTQDDGVRITVRDEGAGIPDYALERIFERFYSLPRPETGKKGSGLGLGLVRQIAELHNGSIIIENRKSKGVEARLTLPGCFNA
jgi:two-component system sensor histidine kinase CreC